MVRRCTEGQVGMTQDGLKDFFQHAHSLFEWKWKVSVNEFLTGQVQNQVVSLQSSEVFLSIDIKYVDTITKRNTQKVNLGMQHTVAVQCICGAMAQCLVELDRLTRRLHKTIQYDFHLLSEQVYFHETAFCLCGHICCRCPVHPVSRSVRCWRSVLPAYRVFPPTWQATFRL